MQVAQDGLTLSDVAVKRIVRVVHKRMLVQRRMRPPAVAAARAVGCER